MDDLDHSMHIAEYDWTSFYEDSEECGLLQPSLAYLDNLSLSDSEDSGNSGSVFSTGQQKLQPSSAAKSDEAESNTAGCCLEEGQINESGSAGDQDLATKDEADSERWIKSDIDYPEGHRLNTEEVYMRTAEDITSTLKNEQPNIQCSGGESTELKKEPGDVEGDTSSIRELDPFSRNRAELNVNEPQAADGAVNEGKSSVRVETERWFVTVNDSPARLRARATSVKKKRRQKKACKNHMCPTTGRDKSGENGLELMKDNQSEGGRETRSNQNLGEHPSSEENPESMQMGVLSDSFQMSLTSGEEDSLSDKVVTSHITELTDRNKHDPSSSGSTLPDTFTSKDPSRLDSVESDELGDSLEFLSTHSYDSESYLSATESVEEPRHLLVEQLQSSSSPTNNNYLFNMTVNADTDNTQDGEMHLSCSVTATNCEGYESTEPTLTFPSAAQSANKMPDDISTCDNDTRCTLPSDSPGLQKQEINLSASAFSSGDRLSLAPVPDVAPCPAADSPETYVEAAGHTRPVYAISAFWDEMEKLTINDILQLRMCRSPPAGDTRETPNAEDFPTNHSSLVDTVDYNSPDAALLDMSDTADSDYFTQPDESKPDRSSCEFSTSDFEEEYWQFLGASRNPSPDPRSKSQKRSCDSPFFAHEEEESTSSEGKETPVPSEDFAGECFEDEDSNSFTSSELSWPRPIAKSKSVRNVQALNTEDLSLQLLISSDESNLFRSSSPSLEENVLLKSDDSLATPFLSNTDALDEHTPIYFPEVFEYVLTEDKANRDSQTVTVYDPEDISVAPVFDYALCSFRDETLFSSLCDSQCFEGRPIPIFSCSRPTIRELTFPNPDCFFLSADCKDEDGISPIRVVSRYFIQGSDLSAGSKCSWRSFLSIRKIRFHDKGSIWCRGSGAWVFPVEAEKIAIKKADPPKAVLTEWRVSSTPSRSLSSILETVQATRREGIFSTLKQSDMCLVCIAFASWVLTSSDPEATDAWKAALLANVSALSAIQYLRQYVKKKNPSQDDP